MIWYTDSVAYRKTMLAAAAELDPPVIITLASASQIFPGIGPVYRRIITNDGELPFVHTGSPLWHQRMDDIAAVVAEIVLVPDPKDSEDEPAQEEVAPEVEFVPDSPEAVAAAVAVKVAETGSVVTAETVHVDQPVKSTKSRKKAK